MNTFNYPHSYTGTNSALTNIPQKDVYPEIPRDAQVGDQAQYAHQNVREFPAWYKPYGFNYMGEGWLIFLLSLFGIGGWSYMRDIKESKGRTSRKVYPLAREDTKDWTVNIKHRWAAERIAAGDPNWVKFTQKKERAAVHH